MLAMVRDWRRYLEQMYTHCKPGGYVELVEIEGDIFSDDGTIKPESYIRVYIEAWRSAMEKSGIKYLSSGDLERLLKEAGFDEVRTYTRKQPFNPWPKVTSTPSWVIDDLD